MLYPIKAKRAESRTGFLKLNLGDRRCIAPRKIDSLQRNRQGIQWQESKEQIPKWLNASGSLNRLLINPAKHRHASLTKRIPSCFN